MKYFAHILLCFLFLSITTVNAKTINFAVVSDVNYGPETNRQEYKENSQVLNGFINRINENNYDFVVFLGDNIAKSKADYLKEFLRKITKINTKYYLVMGDKDVHRISGMSKTEYLNIVNKENKSQKNKDSSYTFKINDEILAIVLDGVSSGIQSTHGIFTKKTLQWLDTTLENNKNKKIIIFQHVPYLEPYEKPAYTMLDKQEYAAIIRRHPNIMLIISGHYGQEYAIKDEKGVYHISTTSLSKTPYYYTEIQVTYDKKLLKKPKDFVINGDIKPAI